MFKLPKLNQKGLTPIIAVLAIVVIAAIGGLLLYQSSQVKSPSVSLNQKNPEKIKVIGILEQAVSLHDYTVGFKQGLKDLGYVEGKNIKFEAYPTEEADMEKKLKSDSPNSDLIFAVSNGAVDIYKASTNSGKLVPIVFAGASNPDRTGIVKSLKSSGNHTAGVANNIEEVTAKKFQFLKEINPNAKRIGIFGTGFISVGSGKAVYAEIKKQAPKQGLEVVEYTFNSPDKKDPTLADTEKIGTTINPGDIDAIVHIPGHFFDEYDRFETDLAKRLKIPNISANIIEVEQGGLFTYNPDYQDVGKQAAVIADKVLKGTKPADIPIEFPHKPRLVLNLKVAKEIGIVFPDSMLNIADRKIE